MSGSAHLSINRDGGGASGGDVPETPSFPSSAPDAASQPAGYQFSRSQNYDSLTMVGSQAGRRMMMQSSHYQQENSYIPLARELKAMAADQIKEVDE